MVNLEERSNYEGERDGANAGERAAERHQQIQAWGFRGIEELRGNLAATFGTGPVTGFTAFAVCWRAIAAAACKFGHRRQLLRTHDALRYRCQLPLF